jgi:hypothetical protein
MLVSLATGQAIGASGSATFPYACRSVSKIFIKIDDDATAYNSYSVTVQLGSRTICNGASNWGLSIFGAMVGGQNPSDTESFLQLDLGMHQLLDNENLYVTVRSSGNALTAVDVSALVDENSGGEFPVRYTEYSDTTFTAENVLKAVGYSSSAGAVDEATGNIEIRNAVSSSSPTLISASNWYGATVVQNWFATYGGLLVDSQVPLTTTFNYTSNATNRILVASLMGTNQRAISQGRRQSAIARSQVGK